MGHFNTSPLAIADSGILSLVKGMIKVPNDCDSTAKGSGVIDFAIHSVSIQPAIGPLSKVGAPWKPHFAFDQTFYFNECSTLVNMQIMPRALPMTEFAENWILLNETEQLFAWNKSQDIARDKLSEWSSKTGIEILGYPDKCLVDDCRFDTDFRNHIEYGETLAQAALSIEICVCSVAGISIKDIMKFCGRSQFPRFGLKQLVPNHDIVNKYVNDELNLWSSLSYHIDALCTLLKEFPFSSLTDLSHTHSSNKHVVSVLRHHVPSIIMCSSNMHYLDSNDIKVMYAPVSSDATDDCVIHFAYVLATIGDYMIDEALSISAHIEKVKCGIVSDICVQSCAEFETIAVEQLSKGAGVIHKYTNRQNTSYMDINLFDRSVYSNTPAQAMESKRNLWGNKWSLNPSDKVVTACKLFALCSLACDDDSNICNMSGQSLHDSAASYRNTSFGSDMWSAQEVAHVPILLLESLATALRTSFNSCCAAYQMLCNLQGCLGKPGDGHRTITKSPILYRLTCREGNHRDTIRQWEDSICLANDSAKKGSSAKKACLKRSFFSELFCLCGIDTGANLFDFEKFFDTVNLPMLLDLLNKKQYPLKHLCFAIQQHCAPRRLQVKNITSESVSPINSILAGCFHSVPFIKGLLHDELVSFTNSFPNSPMSTHVDDCVQFVFGTFDHVRDVLVRGAVKWAKSSTKLKLILSSKSTVVCGSSKLAKCVVKELAQLDINLEHRTFARDLGINFTGGKVRATSLICSRFAKAKLRTKKVAQLAKSCRTAKKLFRSGVFPQSTWGHEATGFTSTQAKNLRRMASSSTGIRAGGRCSTTAIFICYGHRNDPLQIACKELLCEYFDLLDCVDSNFLVSHLSLAWSKAVQQANSNNNSVRNVCGILTNIVYTLIQYCWVPRQYNRWIAPNGDTWYFPPSGFPRQHIILAIQDTIALSLWKRASQHHAGKGLESGLAWAPSTSLIRKLKTKHVAQVPKSLALETIMCGCCWSPARTLAAYPSANINPCGCGEPVPDEYHQYWGCPLLASAVDIDIRNSNKHTSMCNDEYTMYPCLWLRGLLPNSLLVTDSVPLAQFPLFIVGPSPPAAEGWPGGYYGTDASGGTYSSIPQLRRVGVGVCKLSTVFPHPFEFGAWSALCGDIQTIPRGELFCFVLLLRNAMFNQHFHVFSDSKVNIANFNKGSKHCKHVPNGDLWTELFSLLDSKKCSLVLEFVPSHIFEKNKKSVASTSVFAILNNTAADRLAEFAAGRVEVAPGYATPILFRLKLVKTIQLRLFAIVASVAKHVFTKEQKLRNDNDPIESHVAASKHSVSCIGSRYVCSVCKQSVSNLSNKCCKAWLASYCDPSYSHESCIRPCKIKDSTVMLGNQVAHASHSLFFFRGITYCNRCGCKGIDRFHKLADQCESIKAFGKSTLNALNQGKLPPGLTRWPDLRANSCSFSSSQDA